MKAPPSSTSMSKHDWSNIGTLFQSMLTTSFNHNIPLFNDYILPQQYSNLEGMPSDVNNRWGDEAISKIMSEQKINESLHDMFGCRTMNKKIGSLEKLGLEYMKTLEQHESNNTIFHTYNVVDSKATIKSINEAETHSSEIVHCQTLIYNWLTQFKSCTKDINHMHQSMCADHEVSYLYDWHEEDMLPRMRYLSESTKLSKAMQHKHFLTFAGREKIKMEINAWRIVPLTHEADFLSQYFEGEMVNTKLDSYTPYWTTIDYAPAYNQFSLEQDLKSIISDPNVFPITLSKTHFLFVHRLLGFFCLRSLHPKLELSRTEYNAMSKLCVNFRSSIRDINNKLASQNHILFSAYETDVKGKGVAWPHASTDRGKRIFSLSPHEYENLLLNTMDGLSENLKWECRNLATSSAGGSASPKHYARRLKAFYGLCVGMCSIKKSMAYKKPSGGHILADSIIRSFNDNIHEGVVIKTRSFEEGGFTKPVLFHGPLRSIYKADTKPKTWSEIVNDAVEEMKVPRPTHASEFIPSWKDMRKPITVNVSGAPPIGFYHKERRCKVCNGRVILTTPAHCKTETVQCPHCREGKIEVNE